MMLCGFEESQAVCIAFREIGIEAYSCDIQDCSGGHPEWHIKGDVLPLLNGHCKFKTCDGVEHTLDGRWDLIIAHPPCTYLSNAGAARLFRVIDGKHYIDCDRFNLGLKGREVFMKVLNADCDHIVVENPTPSKCFQLPQYTQVIQPYQFGDPYTKRTLLWIKGLPNLKPTNEVKPIGCWVQANGAAWKKKVARGEKVIGAHKSPKVRSKTFKGIAQAFSTQYGNYLKEINNA